MAQKMRMEWDRLLTAERLCDPRYQPQEHRSIYVQDHDRIVFSAPFRRLANKTQVEPLYQNDHVHHRLIHSIEVSSVGRSLAMKIGQWLVAEGHLPETHIYSLADITQAACVAHDIGNPPFGHSGEEAIGGWFAEKFDAAQGLVADLPQELRPEFTAFEGNAQGFRILTRLEMYRGEGGMRLSKATLGAFSKYPVTAADRAAFLPKASGGKPYAGLKKFGLFRAEVPLFEQAAASLGLPQITSGTSRHWRRHPLVFVMEAADDITYNIVDLEDAFTTGELPFETVRKMLCDLAGQPNNSTQGMTEMEEIAYLRARSIGRAVEACVAAFISHYEAIMTGQFSEDLVSASPVADSFAAIKKMARERIFTAPRKTELEIMGRRVITNVLNGLLPVYEDLARAGWKAEGLTNPSRQLVRALALDLRDVSDAESALHALADFTSGMTDRYALRISRMLSGT